MKIAKVINEMYTELFSRFQPVIEQKLEKLLSLGRDLGAKETKTRDRGIYCNLQQDNSNEKKLFHQSLQHTLRFQVLARQAVKVLPAVAQPVSFTPGHTPWKI